MAERVLVGAGIASADDGVVIAKARVKIPGSIVLSNQPGERFSLLDVKVALQQMREQIEIEAFGSSGESVEILRAMAMMLSDKELFEEIKARMSEGADAATAIRGGFGKFARKLKDLGGHFAERSNDLQGIAERTISKLVNEQAEEDDGEKKILIAEKLSPVDISNIPENISGFITEEGGISSHTAVMARANKLPAVMGVVGAGVIKDGDNILLDATSGQVFINPSQDELANYKAAIATEVDPSLKTQIPLLANVGSAIEGGSAIKAGAEGVGLYRTELLFLGRKDAPGLEEQVFEYSRLLARFKGKLVIARLLDLDFDKPLPFLTPAGEGDYFGRGLATLMANPEVINTQLEALAKASSYYPETELWVMAPMVTNYQEAKRFIEMAKPFDFGKLGVMVEVPELATPQVLQALFQIVDFVSIGSNDLAQYVLRRPRSSFRSLSDAKHPEVISRVAAIIEAGKQAGKPVSICGEIAGEPEAAQWFIDLGASSLSASSALLPALRQKLAV
jgi:phosphotransferase system enzyme I (PtsI)